MPHVQEPGLEVGDYPQCDPQKMKIIHVGMGAAGMLTAYKARKMLSNYELVCYEKNDSVGGMFPMAIHLHQTRADSSRYMVSLW